MQKNWMEVEEDEAVAVSTSLSDAGFDRFARFITGELGIQMPRTKLTMLQSRLLRRARDLRLGSIEEYGNHFFAAPSETERQYFINLVTTNKTDFFREPEHFEYLRNTVLPTLLKNRDPQFAQLNLWSAASSSGQEAYTLAMVLSEYSETVSRVGFSILGTDISTQVLGQAQQAIYEEDQARPIPPELRKKYIMRSKDPADRHIRIVPTLRARTSFRKLNFMDANYAFRETFDIVFCRNVLIYFDRQTQEAVIQKICRHIKPGGYLFVGHAESLNAMQLPVRQVDNAVFQLCPPGAAS